MRRKGFIRLIIWELEEYWSFPIPEIIIFIAVFSLLGYTPAPTSFSMRYWLLENSLTRTPIFLILIVGVLFSRSLAGSIGNREMIVLLSFPVKRWHIFLSKLIVNFLMIFIIFGSILMSNIPLLALSPLEPAAYISLMILLLQLLFLSSVTIVMSLITKNGIASILTSILLLYGLEFALCDEPTPLKCFSLDGGVRIMFDYLVRVFYPLPRGGRFTYIDFILALLFPLLTSITLIISAFIYFQWIMEID